MTEPNQTLPDGPTILSVNYYEILGVQDSADQASIKKRWLTLASEILSLLKTPYTLRSLRLRTFSGSLDSWHRLSSRCFTRSPFSFAPARRYTWRSSRSGTSSPC